MTDLRARLADALVEHGDYFGFLPDVNFRRLLMQTIADVLLSLPPESRIAIVELPDNGTVLLGDDSWVKSPELHRQLSAMWHAGWATPPRRRHDDR